MERLDGKICIITGGAQGLGAGTARLFAREGATVVIADADEDRGRSTEADLVALGSDGYFVRTDVGKRREVIELVERVHGSFGRVDVLVNGAMGFSPHVALEGKTDAMFDAVLNVGFYGAVWGMQAVFPGMRDQGGGRIVNFYSSAATSGQWLTADHNVATSAIVGLTNTAAAEWAKYGILCNAVAPFVALADFGTTRRDSMQTYKEPKCPLGRIGDPESDIAPVVLFFASDDSRYVTGSIIQVDGGIGLRTGPDFSEQGSEQIESWLAHDGTNSTSILQDGV